MKWIGVIGLSFLVGVISCTTTVETEVERPAAETSTSPLDGAWEFVRLDTPEGPNQNEVGEMVVHGNKVCHLRVGREREAVAQGDSEEQRSAKAAALYGSTTAACGTFTLEGDRLTVNWTTSSNPTVEGNTTEFEFTSEGDVVILAPAANPQFRFVYRRTQ